MRAAIPAILAIASFAYSQEFEKDLPSPPPIPAQVAEPPVGAKAVPRGKQLPQREDWAVRIAEEDARLHAASAPFYRYVWVPGGKRSSQRAVSFAINTISRSSAIALPSPLADGTVLRVDLRLYCGGIENLPDYIDVWEKLQFDPAFSLLITKDTLDIFRSTFPVFEKSAKRTRIEKTNWRLVDCKPYRGENAEGRVVLLRQKWEFDTREVAEDVSLVAADISKAELVRLNAEHIDQRTFLSLQQLTRSQAPVVHYQYFLQRALTSITDDGTYKIVFGGLYYEFVGVRQGKGEGTDEDRVLETFGVGNVKAGLTARKIFDGLRSDQRAAISRSLVTKRPRQIEWFPTLATRDGLVSFAFFTADIGRNDIEISQHPLMNLRNLVAAKKHRAREAIIGKTNGLHLFLLFDNQGKLQQKAPDNVARNHMVPPGESTELEGAISCIWCHGVKPKLDGWQPFGNDVYAMSRKRLDIFGDISDPNKPLNDVVDQLASWYAGTPDRTLRLARDAYAEGVLRSTGAWVNEGGKLEEGGVVQLASLAVVDLYSDWRYATIDAARALKELSVDDDIIKAAKSPERALVALAFPDAKANVGGIVPEDPRIGLILYGPGVDRSDFSMVRSILAARVHRTLSTLKRAG